MAFFDKSENTSGALVARLGVDTASIRGAVGDQVGVLVQNLVSNIRSWSRKPQPEDKSHVFL